MVEVTIGCCRGGSVASCVVRGECALSVVPVLGRVGPGLTVRFSVDGWLAVVGSVVYFLGCWVGCGVLCVLGLLFAWVAFSGASTGAGWFPLQLNVGIGGWQHQDNVCCYGLT